MATAGKYFRKVYKGNKAHIDFKIQLLEGRITGDWNQLRFLLENLIDEACSVTLDGAVCLSAREDGEFIRFLFTDIRDHDEFAGRRGCRINAEPGKEGGFTIYFTLPKK